jgi:hypothetical protein
MLNGPLDVTETSIQPLYTTCDTYIVQFTYTASRYAFVHGVDNVVKISDSERMLAVLFFLCKVCFLIEVLQDNVKYCRNQKKHTYI